MRMGWFMRDTSGWICSDHAMRAARRREVTWVVTVE
jgi:hypothetical protein